MSDEFDVIYLNHEDSQAVIHWAAHTAALAILMQNAPENPDDRELQFEGFKEGIDLMVETMPVCLIPLGEEIANNTLVELEEEERIVENFNEQLKDL